jgi:acyl dehydratase
MATIHLDDLKPGMTLELGSVTVTREEILDFAGRYDPQPIHVDEAAARRSIYGGLIASGWLTVSLCMRRIVDGFLGRAASLGSPGCDEVRWLKPVRPGDTLTYRAEILEVTPSRSKPDRGIARVRYEAVNQAGEPVLRITGMQMLGRRPVSTA